MSDPVTIEAWPEPASRERALPNALRGVALRFGIQQPCERLHFRVRGQELAVVALWSKGKHGISVSGFELTRKTARRPKLVLRQEVARDLNGKALGLNREVQTGDPTFDGRVYIEASASDRAVLQTLESPGVRHGVVELLARGAAQVEIGPDSVGAKFSRQIDGDAEIDPDVILSVLDAFATVLESLPTATLEIPKGDASSGCAFLVVVVILLPIAAVVAYILTWAFRDSTGIVGYEPFILGAGFGAVLAVTGTALSFVITRLRPSAVGYRVFIARVVWCFFVFLPAGTPILMLVDLLTAPRAPAQVIDTTLVDYTVSKGEWELEVASWNRPGQTEVFEVGEYPGVSSGGRLRLTVRKGGLGFQWVRGHVALPNP